MSVQDNEESEISLSEKKAQLKVTVSRLYNEGYTRSTTPRQPGVGLPSTVTRHNGNESRRPLIDQVSNKWQDEKSSYSTFEDGRGYALCDPEEGGSCSRFSRDAVRSKRCRRMMFTILLLVGLGLWMWKWYLRVQWQEDWEYKEGFVMSDNGTFGIAKGGHFDGVRVQDIDMKLLPGGENDPEGKRRLVFVGDIHGCAHELKKLLKTLDFNEHTDHLIAVGDVISKGPDSAGVLDELIRLGASSVRGNHEDRILAIAPSVLEFSLPPPTADTTSNGFAKDAALLRELSKHHLKYLRSMPLMLRVPALPLASEASHKSDSPLEEEILVVHAGLVPAVPLEKQDPYFVMNMRSIHSKTHVPMVEAEDKKAKTKPWHDIWCWYNDRLFKHKSLKDFRVWEENPSSSAAQSDSGRLQSSSKNRYPDPQVVVYGHRSKEGLQVHRWTKGLDTGCVSGGDLTAMVLDAKGRQEIVQVGCKDNRS